MLEDPDQELSLFSFWILNQKEKSPTREHKIIGVVQPCT